MPNKCLAAFTPIGDPDGSLVPFINAYEDDEGVIVRVRSKGVGGVAAQAEIVLTREEWVEFITEATLNGSTAISLLLMQSALKRIAAAQTE